MFQHLLCYKNNFEHSQRWNKNEQKHYFWRTLAIREPERNQKGAKGCQKETKDQENHQKSCFETVVFFLKKLIEFIHTCTLYLRNTYKCAMTVFTILKKKNLMKKTWWFSWSLAPFWLPLAPFWLPLAPFWLPSNVKLLQKSCFCWIWFHLLLMFETIFVKK